MGQSSLIQRVKVFDFEDGRKSIENRMFVGPNPHSRLLGGDEPTAEESREHQEDCAEDLAKLESLEKCSNEEPIFFKGRHELPHWIPDTNSLESRPQFHFFVFHSRIYQVSGPHTNEEFQLLVFREYEREERLFKGLKGRYSEVEKEESGEEQASFSRTTISGKVRRYVWRRDKGQCSNCGSRELLEYDHIIPVSKGGGNTERNIELLCEECNRRKGAEIG